MSDKDSELVLTVSASRVREVMGGRNWLDFKYHPPGVVLDRLDAHSFVPRGICERDEFRKQVIPYAILRYRDKVFCYTRGQAGGEDRLHARWSIGIGGHINPGDEPQGKPDLFMTIYRAANREVYEEVGTARVWDDHSIGLISDDSDAVGRVHLGFAMVYELLSPDIAPTEAALRDGKWVTLDELAAEPSRLENWSRICVEHLARKAVAK